MFFWIVIHDIWITIHQLPFIQNDKWINGYCHVDEWKWKGLYSQHISIWKWLYSQYRHVTLPWNGYIHSLWKFPTFPCGIILPFFKVMFMCNLLGWWAWIQFSMANNTSSTAQGGGGSFKNRKPIGEIGCCESRMAERSHWWTERWLRSLSLSLTTYLSTVAIYLSI